MFDGQAQNKGGFDATRRTSSSYTSVRKTASTSNFADDLASIFGGNILICAAWFSIFAFLQ